MFKTLPQDDSGPPHLGCQPAELLIRDLEAYDGGRTTDSESVVGSAPFIGRSSPIWVKGHTSVPSAGWFWRLQIKIHDNRLLTIPHDNGFALVSWISINLLVRYIGRNVNKISSCGFVTEFQAIAPTHPHSSFQHVQDGFQLSMVVRSCLRIRLDDHGPSPQRS